MVRVGLSVRTFVLSKLVEGEITMVRQLSPTVPANYSERRIIALENFMQGTHLRGKEALDEFNRQEIEQHKRPAAPLIAPDPGGYRLKQFYARIDETIEKMRGNADYWKYRTPRRG
jgi:hypothetical protein